ncbi:MAG: heme NO-binding protein [Alphaproteobacteria bacterium]|nr:heme NO-binding protein [Alphaproteobacteria bacterium]
MHGLFNRALECFLRDTYGAPLWRRVARDAGCPEAFEALAPSDPDTPGRIVDAAAAALAKPRAVLLEDLGTYLPTHPRQARIRRLLRFGGVDFVDFLHSLEDLPGRARLALPDLALPAIDLRAEGGGRYSLSSDCGADVGHVMIGLLRAMADDYGTLVVLEHEISPMGRMTLGIDLPAPHFAAGRRFELARQAAG